MPVLPHASPHRPWALVLGTFACLLAVAPDDARAGEGARISLDLSDLVDDSVPFSLEGHPIEVCTGAHRSLDDVIDTTDRAARALALMDFADAARKLERAERDLLCIEGPVAASVAARIPFLDGIRAWMQGDATAARAAFRSALVLRPDLPWDETFPPEAMVLFDTERSTIPTLATATLRLLPSPEGLDLWVDGRDMGDGPGPWELAPGRHYVQLGTRGWQSLRVELEPGATETLVVPSADAEVLASWLDQPALAPAVSASVASALPAGTPAELLLGDARFEGRVGEAEWSRLPPPVVTRPTVLPRVTAATGVFALGLGSALAISGRLQVDDAVQDSARVDNWADYRKVQGSYQLASSNLRTGRWLAIAGGVTAGAGLIWTWQVPTRELRPAVTP